MKVFSVHWKQAGKGGLDGFVIAEDEDSAFEKAMKYLSGEIKYTKDVLPKKYVWVKSSSMAYFIKEEYGWVVE
jgi:hypothetical protein